MGDYKKKFDSWIRDVIGEFDTQIIPIDYPYGRIAYYKSLFIDHTIQMVIRPPVVYNYRTGSYCMKKHLSFDFFLYDIQTDVIFGHISELDIYDWKDDLKEFIFLAEERMKKSYCPCCDFWLVERENVYGHKFMGCSGFPDCEFSAEIDDVYD